MALTGLCWSFQWYRDAGSTVMGTEIFGGRRGPRIESEAKIDKNENISVAKVQQITDDELAYAVKLQFSFYLEKKVFIVCRNTKKEDYFRLHQISLLSIQMVQYLKKRFLLKNH